MDELQKDLDVLAKSIHELIKSFDSSHEVKVTSIELGRVDTTVHSGEFSSCLYRVACQVSAQGQSTKARSEE